MRARKFRLLAEFPRYATSVDLCLMMATSLPFGAQNGEGQYLQPHGLKKSCFLPKTLGRECAASSEGGSWPQVSLCASLSDYVRKRWQNHEVSQCLCN